jgi:hypothetical protein
LTSLKYALNFCKRHLSRISICQAEHGGGHIANPNSTAVKASFGLAIGNGDVTPIRYRGGPLLIACGGGELRIVTDNGRSFDRGNANFAWALGSSLLDGLLDSRGLALLVEILSVITDLAPPSKTDATDRYQSPQWKIEAILQAGSLVSLGPHIVAMKLYSTVTLFARLRG